MHQNTGVEPGLTYSVGGDRARTEHAVQLFDTAETLTEAVAEFLHDGFVQGDTLLVVSTDHHWGAISSALRDRGMLVDQARASGQLTIRDAHDTLDLLMLDDRPDRDLFDVCVGALVRELTERGERLRIYGEMVDLLAVEGEYANAGALEELWNELGEHHAFHLFCGYSAANFGDPRTAEALRSICRAHSHVRSSTRDVLGSFLVDTHCTSSGGSSAA